MHPVPALLLVTLLSLCTAQNIPTEGISDALNTVETKPSSRLDPYIRKALLKALSELEESDNQTTGFESTDQTANTEFSTQESSNGITDGISIHSPKEGIQIHSFVVNGQSAFINNTNFTPTLLDDKISILSTTAGNVENHVAAFRPTLPPNAKNYNTREISINNQQVRSISNSDLLRIKNEEKTTTNKPIPSTTRITTTTTTTTTTPKPTHNDDGENIEEVDKRDVQVYQAPLVAAFTVHQDAQGLPKQVIPIYQHTINDQQLLKPVSTNNILSSILPSESIRHGTSEFNLNINQATQNEFITRQLALQRELEEKQRILEEQLRLLQLQQRQQEELLQRQQFLLQQKQAERQQQNIFDQDQQKRQQFQVNRPVNNFLSQKNIQQSQNMNQNQGLHSNNSPVTIQGSIPIITNQPSLNLLGNQQQLPSREAVDFLLHLRNKHSEQFPLQENHLPQGVSSFLEPNPTQTFHQGLNFNQLRPDQVNLNQNTRVFRQETGVGNFGINNVNYNRFNTFNPVQMNRFFPQQIRPNQFHSDFELKQLLMQSGLNGRNPEDLNIVSKVLSLNHGVSLNNNVSNRLPFDSRRHVNPFV